MINVDMRSLLGKLNTFCGNTLQNAAGLCVTRTHYEVTVEHFLFKARTIRKATGPLSSGVSRSIRPA
jgi:type VI secretion system protein VasG